MSPFNMVSLLAVVMAAGCGSDSKKSNGNDSTVESIETTIVGPVAEGPGSRFKYKSNVANATFQCQIAVEGREGTWSACGEEGFLVVPQPGIATTFKVKAIGPNGLEDVEPAIATVKGAAAAAATVAKPATSTPDFAAEIIGKKEVARDWSQPNLTLNLGVKGGAVAANQVAFQCKLEGESQFTACPDGNSYNFSGMKDGQYGLTVRAVHKQTGAISAEDHIVFNVSVATLAITGEAQLLRAKSGKVNLGFDQNAIQGLDVSCAIGSQAPVSCARGYTVDLSSLRGNQTLNVIARRGSAVVSMRSINFCAGAACGAVVPSGGSPQLEVIAPPTLLLGDSYTFTAAENMQVNSYGTNQTVNGRFAYNQIMYDPYFVGNYDCVNHQAVVKTYGGNVYCDVTPGSDLFGWLTQGTVAMNHIELSTNSAHVVENPIDHTRITLNLFDSSYEFKYVRSRFDWLCRNKRATITRTAHKIPMAHSFWEGELVGAEFMSCVADVAGTGTGFPGSPEKWQVGSFFISSSGFDLPSYDCFRNYDSRGLNPVDASWSKCGDYHNPRLLEVTVMTRLPMYEASEFARYAQTLFLNSLRQAAPMTRF